MLVHDTRRHKIPVMLYITFCSFIRKLFGLNPTFPFSHKLLERYKKANYFSAIKFFIISTRLELK